MVKAILEGRKTQTRRTKGLKEYNENPDKWRIGKMELAGKIWWVASCDSSWAYRIDCPYGQVGDRLWCKEGVSIYEGLSDWMAICDDETEHIVYPSEKFILEHLVDSSQEYSARFCPRWASRITLKITEIRVERLNQIIETDITKEGFGDLVTFISLWDKLNKKRGYGWESNCWVWVITFKQCR